MKVRVQLPMSRPARTPAVAGPVQLTRARCVAPQAKRNVSVPGDPLEREADRAADQAMRAPGPGPEHARLAALNPVSSALPARVPGVHRSGVPLPAPARRWFQSHFGHDLGPVRIHSDPVAHDLAVELNARAFTAGRDIYFRAGQYAPDSTAGQRLLAHELAHVIQQAGGPPAQQALDSTPAGAPVAVRPSPQAASQIQRDVVSDAAGNPTDFEFRVGTELDLSFTLLAQRLLGGGTLHARGLRALREHALRRHGTVDDHERMFMAGLTVAANATTLAATRVGATTAIRFALGTITPNLPAVIDLDRQSVPATVSGPAAAAVTDLAAGNFVAAAAESIAATSAAEQAIQAHAGPFRAQASALIGFAAGAFVSLPDVLAAMLAAASDSSAGDQVMAGTVYAIAAAARHPLASEVRSGHIKVDALLPAAFAALPVPPGLAAAYLTAAQGSGLKGDTIYIPTDFDIGDLFHRSHIIHELQHARDDQAAAGPHIQFQPANQLEENGYRAQGRFLLEQLASLAAADQAAAVTRLAGQLNGLALLGMVIEALADRPRFEPLIAAIGAASHPAVAAAGVTALLNRGQAALVTILRNRITAAYGMTAGQVGVVEGLSGESIVSWIFRT